MEKNWINLSFRTGKIIPCHSKQNFNPWIRLFVILYTLTRLVFIKSKISLPRDFKTLIINPRMGNGGIMFNAPKFFSLITKTAWSRKKNTWHNHFYIYSTYTDVVPSQRRSLVGSFLLNTYSIQWTDTGFLRLAFCGRSTESSIIWASGLVAAKWLQIFNFSHF